MHSRHDSCIVACYTSPLGSFDHTQLYLTGTEKYLHVQDLNIDLQALAVSLAHLPVGDVLNIDPCYCTDFAAAAPDRYAASTDSNKMSAMEASRTSSQNAADDQKDVPDTSTVTQHRLPKGQVAKNTLGKARQDASTAQKDLSNQKHANISTAEPDSASHRPAEVNAAHQDASQRKKDSSKAEEGPSDRMLFGKHGSTAAQTPLPAASSADMDDDDLDAILNATDVDTIKPASTVIQQPAKQDEGSLEDWLNSL